MTLEAGPRLDPELAVAIRAALHDEGWEPFPRAAYDREKPWILLGDQQQREPDAINHYCFGYPVIFVTWLSVREFRIAFP